MVDVIKWQLRDLSLLSNCLYEFKDSFYSKLFSDYFRLFQIISDYFRLFQIISDYFRLFQIISDYLMYNKGK